MKDICAEFEAVKEELGIDDTAAALLVLALAVRKAATFERFNAENFGHELALALKNVLEERPLRLAVEGPVGIEAETPIGIQNVGQEDL